MRVAAGKTVDSRAFDKSAMEAGIPSLILMENAAFSLFIEVKRVIDEWKPERIVVFSGNGGNGGDGFALLLPDFLYFLHLCRMKTEGNLRRTEKTIP